MTFADSYDVRYEERKRESGKRERDIEVRINTRRAGERKFRGCSKRYFLLGEKHYF
jgi:hypothetical protein